MVLDLEHVLALAYFDICPGHSDRVHDHSTILELDVSQGGGRCRRNVPGTFFRSKSMNESSLSESDPNVV